MKKIVFSVLLLLFGFAVAWFSGVFQGKPDYIFLITLDTTRADSIDFFPGRGCRTPHLASLAQSGQFFQRAFSPIPITLPAHGVMLFSQPPQGIGLLNNGQIQDRLPKSLAEYLKPAGFARVAAVSLGVMSREYGLNKGFTHYEDKFPDDYWYKTAFQVNQEAFPLVSRVSRSARKAFFWLHYSDPHEPYGKSAFKETATISLNGLRVHESPSMSGAYVKKRLLLSPGRNELKIDMDIPERLPSGEPFELVNLGFSEFRVLAGGVAVRVDLPLHWKKKEVSPGIDEYQTSETHSILILVNPERRSVSCDFNLLMRLHPTNAVRRKLYQYSVQWMDEQIGRLLEFLKREGIWKRSAFILVGDHGEGLGEYFDQFGHIQYLNSVFTRIPLILAGCGVRKKGERKDLVSLLDIAPTVLALAGVSKPNPMLGSNLLEPVQNEMLTLETYRPESAVDGFSLIRWPYQIVYYREADGKSRMEWMNLDADPLGIHNLFSLDRSALRIEMTRQLLRVSASLLESKGRYRLEPPSPRSLEILKSLGYL